MVTSLRKGAVVGCLLAASLAATFAAGPQDAGQVPLVGPTAGTFKSTVDLVTLNVTVTDLRNRPVPGLDRGDFQVLEDGVTQDVSFFAAGEVPVDVALLVDASSSMQNKMVLVEQAAAGFIRTLRPVDRASVMSFSTQLRIVQPFTSDHGALSAAVHAIVPRGSTALYTALYIALDHLERARRDHAVEHTVRRNAIIVLSDGEDTASLVPFDDMLERARRVGIAIYPIRMSDGEPGSANPSGDRPFYSQSDFMLRSLAQETGGRAFFPMQLTDLVGVYGLVAEELSTQYALGYTPKVERKDGGYRRLAVRIMGRPDARPRTRAGYYAAGPVRVLNSR